MSPGKTPLKRLDATFRSNDCHGPILSVTLSTNLATTPASLRPDRPDWKVPARMTDDERETWWHDASQGIMPWRNARRNGKGLFAMWAWTATAAYLWNAGFQQLAASRQGFHADWNTAGFALPIVILLVLGGVTAAFNSRTTRNVLTALSVFLIHIFVSNVATLAAWKCLGLDPNVVTPQSMLVEIAVAAAGATPVVAATLPASLPLAAAVVLFPLRNAPPARLGVCVPLAAALLWLVLAGIGFHLT